MRTKPDTLALLDQIYQGFMDKSLKPLPFVPRDGPDSRHNLGIDLGGKLLADRRSHGPLRFFPLNTERVLSWSAREIDSGRIRSAQQDTDALAGPRLVEAREQRRQRRRPAGLGDQ